MQFVELAATSAAVAATSARRGKIDLLAAALRGLAPEEIEAGAAYLAGELRQRQIGVGWAAVRDAPPPSEQATLTVAQVDAALAEIGEQSGAGSQARRRSLLGALFGAATADEQRLLVGLLSGEVRQGAQAGLLADAIARAAGVAVAEVRRALLLSGDLKTVARAALTGGSAALGEFTLQVGRPLAPMLAQAAASVDAALEATGFPAAVDDKLDGVRIQVHRSGDDVAVYSRSLADITSRMPDVVAAVRALPARQIVLDGEAVALDPTGRPRPFQETSARAARRAGQVAGAGKAKRTGDVSEPTGADGADRAAEAASPDVLTPYFFDLLHLDGADLLDETGQRRWSVLAKALPSGLLVGRRMVSTVEEAAAAFDAALTSGHEGVVVKAAGAAYDVGRRGAAWVKVKPRHTLDLVVLAAEWGHGRRRGWLSNLHLGARDPAGGGFVMLGKTFKGLTDELLRWQTERLLALATERGDWVVTVRPELVVEIAFDGVQTSPRYPGGVALRFARVLRYREDKPAGEADTIDDVRRFHMVASDRT
ncbi:ATP-dependent DNA ligase [Rugosimonospora africana]|uniref:Probable DNA ligase n=1 Tax=Rugosimonospora africana TaxID=556532 RepID=A0A8J3R169_9ACTN|nr:ATP-dependent DNA ligase [Rugosimonospora africana]GIH20311.1 putative DNA ligase [Rugosimonospora africana]